MVETVDTIGLLTAAECGRIINMCAPKVSRASLADAEGGQHYNPFELKAKELVFQTVFLAEFWPSLERVFQGKKMWLYARFVRYDKGDYFNLHSDDMLGRPKGLHKAICVQLSDPRDYGGGELQIKTKNGTVIGSKLQGFATVFDCMIRHRVTEVVRGTRYSICFWSKV